MTRSLPRTYFHSSTLLRQLNQLAVVDLLEPGYPVAERLASWMSFNDAMALVAAQKIVTRQGQSTKFAELESKLAGMIFAAQGRLAKSMAERCALDAANAGNTQVTLPQPPRGVALEIAASYEPYLRFYLALQREMAANVLKLRIAAREALAGASPGHQALARLDATFAGFMDEQERKCLARVPLLLEQRFIQLRQEHLAVLAQTERSDDPEHWIQPVQWLAVFCHEMQSMLLAELELRLQPVLGLLESLKKEASAVTEVKIRNPHE